MVGPDSAAIMQPTIPVWVALLTAMLGLETLTVQKGVGVVCSVCGAMVMLNVAHIDLASAKTIGMLIMLVQVLCYAVFIVTLSEYLKKVPKPFSVFSRASAVGSVPLVLLAANDAATVSWAQISVSSWAILVYCALGVSFVAHSSVSWAVQHVSPSVPSLYTCLQPIAVTVMSCIVYGDILDVYDFLGMILIIFGLVVTTRAQQQVGQMKRVDLSGETTRLVELELVTSNDVVVPSPEESISGEGGGEVSGASQKVNQHLHLPEQPVPDQMTAQCPDVAGPCEVV
jgi:drug/metabolite transporter (DMT)-like permease